MPKPLAITLKTILVILLVLSLYIVSLNTIGVNESKYQCYNQLENSASVITEIYTSLVFYAEEAGNIKYESSDFAIAYFGKLDEALTAYLIRNLSGNVEGRFDPISGKLELFGLNYVCSIVR